MPSFRSTSRRRIDGAVRLLTLAIVATAVVSVSGCRWLRGDSGYEQSPHERPLEVPPDLDRPQIDPTMSVPEVSSRSNASAPIVLSEAPAAAWQRVGGALEQINGVEITDRAQLLTAYGVRYDGGEFLIRVTASGDGSRVSATTTAGAETDSAAATRLLSQLKQRLG